jgi:hypothetical protein
VRKTISNEVAVRQATSSDEKKVVSVIHSGPYFRFVEDSELRVDAADGLEEYSYWNETYRSGLYATLHEAEHGAWAFAPWIGEAEQVSWLKD